MPVAFGAMCEVSACDDTHGLFLGFLIPQASGGRADCVDHLFIRLMSHPTSFEYV